VSSRSRSEKCATVIQTLALYFHPGLSKLVELVPVSKFSLLGIYISYYCRLHDVIVTSPHSTLLASVVLQADYVLSGDET
jgi:hypothetical protein